MSTKRFLFVFVACALVSVAALVGWQAIPSQKVAADRKYDAIEEFRSGRRSGVDSSYDAIEKMRAKEYAIQRIRSASHLRDLEQIKDTLGMPNNLISASRLEELERIKDTLAVTTSPISESHLEQLERIKNTLGSP